jgi:hypothetical protein
MNPELADWLIEVLCVSKIQNELLLDCPDGGSRRFVVVLLQTALENVGDESRLKLIKSLLLQLDKSKLSRYFTQYC